MGGQNRKEEKENLKLQKMKNTASFIFVSLKHSLSHIFNIFICYVEPRNWQFRIFVVLIMMTPSNSTNLAVDSNFDTIMKPA